MAGKKAIDALAKSKLGMMERMNVAGELLRLPSVLADDEVAEDLMQGEYRGKKGIVVATDRRLLFLETGMLSMQVEDFAYDRITSIQYTMSFHSKIEILASGNHAEITKVLANKVEPFVRHVRSKVEQAGKSASAPPVAGGDDRLAALERLASLHERGLLSDEEFAGEKGRILGA